MGQRTGNQRRVIAITLLVAVPIVLAVLLGAALMRPKSAEDMLRAIPRFPGAAYVEYGLPKTSGTLIWEGDVAQLAYRISDSPDAVLAYYTENMAQAGWDTWKDGTYSAGFSRYDTYFSGFTLGSQAPWVSLDEGVTRKVGLVTAYRVERSGQEITEVTVTLVSNAKSTFRYIP